MCPREGAGPSCAPHPLGFSRSGGIAFPGAQARPRGRGRAWGAEAFGLRSPRHRVPAAQGRPDGPDALPVRPVGVAVPPLAGAGSPALDPPSHSVFRAGRVHRPTSAPERGPLHPRSQGPSARSPGHDRRDAGRPQGAPSGERKKRGLRWGRNARPRRKRLKATSSPSFLFFPRALGPRW